MLREALESMTLGPAPVSGRQAALQICDTFAAVYKAHVGRGPAKTRVILREDLIVVVHEGGITRAEQTLVQIGRRDLAAAQRRALKELIGPGLITTVEALTGRRVRSMMAADDLENGLQSEVFLLEPHPKHHNEHRAILPDE